MPVMYKYPHVVRLGKPEVEGYLDGNVWITPKLDGSNAAVYYDKNTDEYVYQSRTRTLTLEKDNASFMDYMTNELGEECALIKQFAKDNNVILYGEWIGLNKCLGSIKQYKTRGFHVFDIRDLDLASEGENDGYIPFDAPVWNNLREILPSQYLCNPFVKLTNPTEQDILEYVENNHVNLPDNVVGEGVVLKNFEYINKYGSKKVAKIVRKEYHEKKGRKQTHDLKNVEQSIVDMFVTEADLEKTKHKVLIKFNLDSWTDDNKLVGCFISMVYKDLVEEELYEIVKRFKYPTIDFKLLQKLARDKSIEFLGL